MRTIWPVLLAALAQRLPPATSQEVPVYVTHLDGNVWQLEALYQSKPSIVAYCVSQLACEWLAGAANQRAQSRR